MLLPQGDAYGKRRITSRIQKPLKMGSPAYVTLYWQKRFEALGSEMGLFCSYTYVVLLVVQKVNKLYIAFYG